MTFFEVLAAIPWYVWLGIALLLWLGRSGRKNEKRKGENGGT